MDLPGAMKAFSKIIRTTATLVAILFSIVLLGAGLYSIPQPTSRPRPWPVTDSFNVTSYDQGTWVIRYTYYVDGKPQTNLLTVECGGSLGGCTLPVGRKIEPFTSREGITYPIVIGQTLWTRQGEVTQAFVVVKEELLQAK